MDRIQEPKLYAEVLLEKCAAFIREQRWTIRGSLTAAFLAYIYMFANKLPNHDELYAMFSKGTTMSSGRWGLDLLSWVFPNVSVPWLYGVVSVLLLTLACCLITRIFKIRNCVLQALLGGLILVFPSQIATFTFMFTASAYAVAFLLAVATVSFLIRFDKKSVLLAALCFIGSLSIYQAYLSVTVSLLLLYLFFELLEDRQNEMQIFRKGIGCVLFLVASMAAYYGLTKLMWHVSGQQMGQYATEAFALDPASLLTSVKKAYAAFYNILRYRMYGLVLSRKALLLYGILFGLTIFGLIFRLAADRKRIGKIALMLFLLGLLPLGICSMYLLFSGEAIHTLVLYSFIALYVLFAGMADNFLRSGSGAMGKLLPLGAEAAALVMAVILAGNIFIANKAYLYMHMSYENTYFYSTAILTQLQDTPGYSQDAKVAIIGTYTDPDYIWANFDDLRSLVGVSSLSPNAYSIDGFFEHYNGISLNLVSGEDAARIQATEEFAQMPCYPDTGYIQTIGDTIVIKLSENP